ncbi:MAG: hypothetical protein L6V95_09325 [Candidatus Melainabacteria bacterium]|nr:MAG: hypothetical protein L6V95_09325 [Candidatus Melainabacteria bacterium]
MKKLLTCLFTIILTLIVCSNTCFAQTKKPYKPRNLSQQIEVNAKDNFIIHGTFITINPNRPSNDLWSFCYIHWGAIKMISNR